MTNVTPFRKRTVTVSPANRNRKSIRSDEFKVENVHRIAAMYAPVPAWIAARPILNKAVTLLRERGWTVDCYPDNKILCFHPRVQNNGGVNIIDAMEIEIVFNHHRSQGGAA